VANPAHVLTVGSVNMDLVIRVPRLPLWGECLMGADFQTIPGGKGANQALGAARAGVRSSLVGRVGGDIFGAELRAGLERGGVDVSHLKADPEAANGVALIMLQPSGENCIVIAGGANMRCTPQDVEEARPVFEKASMLLIQLEITPAAVKRALEVARECGVPIFLDPAPAHNFTPDLMEGVFVAAPNETEAQTITGIDCSSPEGAEQAARRLVEMGARHGIVKLGERGLVWFDGQQVRRLAAFSVEPVDTTAAGDAFAAGFAAAFAQGEALEGALIFASAAAATSVTRMGAQPSMATGEEIRDFLAARPRPSFA
jgi:ribokinase